MHSILTEKIAMYFFIVVSVLVIFSSVFPSIQSSHWVVVFLFCGILLALLNVTEDEEKEVILSGLAFFAASWFLQEVLSAYVFFHPIVVLLKNISLVVAPIVLFVSLKYLLTLLASRDSRTSHFSRRSDRSGIRKVWDIILLLSVAGSIILLVFDFFFAQYSNILYLVAADMIITVVFIADVFYLYATTEDKRNFVRNHLVDVIAAVPNVALLRVFKILRIVRILRISSVTKSVKLFSNKSSFNGLLAEKRSRSRRRR